MNAFSAVRYINRFKEMLDIRDLTDNTEKSYISMLNSYLKWVQEKLQKQPEKVSFAEIRQYVLHLKKNVKLNNRSINAHISQLIFFYQYVLHIPWNKYEVPFMKFNTKLPKILTQEQVQTFISTIPDLRQKACIALLYSAGLRVSEMRHLRYEDISRGDMRIYIRNSKSRSDGYTILSSKTLDILTDYWYNHGRPKGWLFPGQKRGKPISREAVPRFIKNHCERLGWNISISAHMFRHAFGTHLYEQGYDILTIQKLLRHKSLTSTLIYVQLSERFMSEIVSPFDRNGGIT